MENEKQSRVKMARQTATELVDQIEGGTTPITDCLLKAKRLARLLRDTDAQTWLDHELRGYPERINPSQVGGCIKYIRQANRLFPDGRTFATSLPKLEAAVKTEEYALTAIKLPSPGAVKNFVEAGATNEILNKLLQQHGLAKISYQNAVNNFSAMKASLHQYATDSHLSLELGDLAEGIFEASRSSVDAFVRANCPQAAEQLLAVSERMNENSSESRSQALTSCRRLLSTIADAVFPPRSEPFTDGNGKERKVGPEQYVNRLLAFLEARLASGSSKAIAKAEMEHLAARLTALYEKHSKGVHSDVSEDETRLVVVHTYLLMAEIARASKLPQNTST
ncbi:MAG: hypothetical protein EOO71_28960 [Myxococcaceae bacterium]|nr:MAG: hypothetical protein EOO71_28960 [Myxococcaceae bacterium]